MAPSTPTVSDSPAFDSKQWLELVSKPLDRSDSKTGRADGGSVDGYQSAVPWGLMQRVDDPDPARAASQAIEDLQNGANGLALVFAGAPNAFGFGLPSNLDTLRAALKDVPLQDVHLRVDVHPQSRASIDWLAELLQEKQVNPAGVHLSFGVDPASLFVGSGQLRMSLEALEASLPQSLGGFFALSLPGVLLESDGRVYHNAGASEIQELGIILASAASHLKMFEDARQPLVYAMPHLGFAISVDQDLVASTAKLRALRLLWARMLSEYGIEPAPIPIHAETSFRMLSARDPQTNIIRTTMATFAAAIGGADTISVLPHTLPVGLPDRDARRIARNTCLVQGIESGSQEFISAHSAAVDSLAEHFCQGAWDEFSRIQSEGGVLRSIASGAIQARIAEERQAHLQRLSEGDRNLIGATLYADAAGPDFTALQASPPKVGPEAAVTCEPLLAHRFEALIDDTERSTN